MKEKRDVKVSISKFVFGILRKSNINTLDGKTAGASIIPQVRKHYPGSKFKQTHVSWYLSQARKQKAAGLSLDSLHGVNRKKGNKSRTGGRPAKKASRKALRKEITE